MKRVDVTGEICPRPALIVRRELSDLDDGETLLVEGDYPPAERNLRRSCTTHGFEVRDADDRVESDGDTFGLAISAPADEATED
jgi:tRNA 2-thiouridine synthesizing protein A